MNFFQIWGLHKNTFVDGKPMEIGFMDVIAKKTTFMNEKTSATGSIRAEHLEIDLNKRNSTDSKFDSSEKQWNTNQLKRNLIRHRFPWWCIQKILWLGNYGNRFFWWRNCRNWKNSSEFLEIQLVRRKVQGNQN